MTMHDSDLRVETRKALGDIVDRTPMAPEWPELELDAQRPYPSPIMRPRRGLAVALGSAVAVIAVVGAVAWLDGPRDAVRGEPTVTAATMPTSTTLPPATTAPPTTAVEVPRERINLADLVVAVTASSEISPAYAARNLIDGLLTTAWNDAGSHGDGAELTFEFSQPVYIDSIVITNLQDQTNLLRNFRIKELEIGFVSETGPTYVASTAPGTSAPHVVDIGDYHRGTLVIRVLSVWPSQAIGDQSPFAELAVAEVEFYGSPAPIDEALIGEMEVIQHQLRATVARIDEEIATLQNALETASGEVAEELNDRLAAVKSIRVQTLRQLETLQDRIDQAVETAGG